MSLLYSSILSVVVVLVFCVAVFCLKTTKKINNSCPNVVDDSINKRITKMQICLLSVLGVLCLIFLILEHYFSVVVVDFNNLSMILGESNVYVTRQKDIFDWINFLSYFVSYVFISALKAIVYVLLTIMLAILLGAIFNLIAKNLFRRETEFSDKYEDVKENNACLFSLSVSGLIVFLSIVISSALSFKPKYYEMPIVLEKTTRQTLLNSCTSNVFTLKDSTFLCSGEMRQNSGWKGSDFLDGSENIKAELLFKYPIKDINHLINNIRIVFVAVGDKTKVYLVDTLNETPPRLSLDNVDSLTQEYVSLASQYLTINYVEAHNVSELKQWSQRLVN